MSSAASASETTSKTATTGRGSVASASTPAPPAASSPRAPKMPLEAVASACVGGSPNSSAGSPTSAQAQAKMRRRSSDRLLPETFARAPLSASKSPGRRSPALAKAQASCDSSSAEAAVEEHSLIVASPAASQADACGSRATAIPTVKAASVSKPCNAGNTWSKVLSSRGRMGAAVAGRKSASTWMMNSRSISPESMFLSKSSTFNTSRPFVAARIFSVASSSF
mmetsp:Transcript_41132/g.130275  ORF Transcript_41132/g.130275 Transcript_41132/m.130275 type:complete len:224 (-) Transcript_41132:294-965(-)